MRIALALAEELHFGRTADRLHLSQSRVSKQLSALERELGAALFERTSRRVRLTPLGRRFLAEAEPAYAGLLAAAETVRRTAANEVRLGFFPTTGGAALTRLIRATQRDRPDLTVELVELSLDSNDFYRPVRDGTVDVMVTWRTGSADTDIVEGPAIDRQRRVAAMSADSPLAGRSSISVLEVGNWKTFELGGSSIGDLFLPPATSDNVPIPRDHGIFTSLAEFLGQIALGHFTHATVGSLAEIAHRDDIAYVPIHDLPPIDLVLVRSRRNDNPAAAAMVAVARSLRTP